MVVTKEGSRLLWTHPGPITIPQPMLDLLQLTVQKHKKHKTLESTSEVDLPGNHPQHTQLPLFLNPDQMNRLLIQDAHDMRCDPKDIPRQMTRVKDSDILPYVYEGMVRFEPFRSFLEKLLGANGWSGRLCAGDTSIFLFPRGRVEIKGGGWTFVWSACVKYVV